MIIRRQLVTQVHIRLGGLVSLAMLVRNRAKGGLTGSRVAGVLARIPVECMAMEYLQK